MTKVTYLSASKLPSTQANGIHVMEMCSALSRSACEVTLHAALDQDVDEHKIFYSYGKDRTFSLKGVRRVNLPILGSILYGLASAIQLISKEVDLIYARCPHSVFFSLWKRAPFIYEAHDIPNRKLRRVLEAIIFKSKHLARIAVISKALKDDYLSMFPSIDPSMIEVLPDGANVPSESSADSFCLARSGSKEKLVVGYFGSFYPGKGVEMASQLAERMGDLEFQIVGGTREQIEMYSSTASENTLYGERIDHREVFKRMRQVDILILPAGKKIEAHGGGNIAKYTSPLKLFEYMSAGRPIICSELPVLAEVITDGKNGLMASPDSIEAWVAAIERLKDENLRSRLAEAALLDLSALYSWDVRARKIIELLNCKNSEA